MVKYPRQQNDIMQLMDMIANDYLKKYILSILCVSQQAMLKQD